MVASILARERTMPGLFRSRFDLRRAEPRDDGRIKPLERLAKGFALAKNREP